MSDDPEDVEEVLHADVRLYAQLRDEGCDGPLWDLLAGDLYGYGWVVMSAWLSSGLIAHKCAEKGRPVALPSDITPEDREDLVASALPQGVDLFRRSIRADLWKPELGASLRTYFLGSCLLVFSGIVRRWVRDRERYRNASSTWALESLVNRQPFDPFDLVDVVEALADLVRDESVRNQSVAKLLFLDFSPAEIANVLGISPGAVHSAIHRMRKRLKAEGEEAR